MSNNQNKHKINTDIKQNTSSLEDIATDTNTNEEVKTAETTNIQNTNSDLNIPKTKQIVNNTKHNKKKHKKKFSSKKSAKRTSSKKYYKVTGCSITVNILAIITSFSVAMYFALDVTKNLLLNKTNLAMIKDNFIMGFFESIFLEDTYTTHINAEIPTFFETYKNISSKVALISFSALIIIVIIYKIIHLINRKKNA